MNNLDDNDAVCIVQLGSRSISLRRTVGAISYCVLFASPLTLVEMSLLASADAVLGVLCARYHSQGSLG